jgi:surfactin synthase thioesterase subunit
MSRDVLQEWWVVPTVRPAAQLRLFCIPYAGGSATVYHRFGQAMPAAIEVATLQVPGRGFRLREPAIGELGPLLAAIEAAIAPRLDRPYALFGHSLGALIAFELTRRLRRSGRPAPEHLFVSASPAPRDSRALPLAADLAAPQLWAEVNRLYGTPAQVLDDPELLALVVPPLKADVAMLAAYRYAAEAPLAVPITAFVGSSDPRVDRAGAEGWRVETTAGFAVHEVQGPHLYLQQAQGELVARVSGALLPGV